MGGLISGVIGGAIDIGTGIDQAHAEVEANKLNLDRERRAANVAIENARLRGAYEQQKIRIEGERASRAQNVAYAASGVDPGSGTAAEVQANTAALTELDAQTAAINAAREVWGYEEAKRQSEENWKMNERNISRKMTGQLLGGLSKGVGGIASMSGMGGGGGTASRTYPSYGSGNKGG